MSKRKKTNAMRPVGAALVLALATPVQAQVTDDSIKAKMAGLQPLIGSWNVAATFHGRKGEINLDDGTFQVAPILGGSYLQINATLIPRDRPDRAHSFMELLTFNPQTKKYEGTYFYSRSAVRVSEQGELDPGSNYFRTLAYIPHEDGVRNENVRTIMQFVDPQHLKYTHFSRYDDEPAETQDLVIDLSRIH